MINRFIFNEFVWWLSRLLAWPHLYIQKKRMEFIFGKADYPAELESIKRGFELAGTIFVPITTEERKAK